MRSELFNADQMEQHGRQLASTHRVVRGVGSDLLLRRLTDNEAVIIEACNLLTAAIAAGHRITPAGEWLLGNYYLIEEQERIARSDAKIDAESLARFVAAYQEGQELQLGELWTIPIMLRLALIENLRRVAVRISTGRRERNVAVEWAEKMLATAETDPKSLVLVIADMARSPLPMASPFVSELTRRLQGHGQSLALPVTWIEQWLAEAHLTIDQLVLEGNQQQAADQVSIGNSIGGLRLLGQIDWRDFVEAASMVDSVLRQDPLGSYDAMDFQTRDQYRHVVEASAILRPGLSLALRRAAHRWRGPLYFSSLLLVTALVTLGFTALAAQAGVATGPLVLIVRDGIAALNARHRARDGDDRFFLFHRARTWNPRERCWMGWERKRGKLEQMNELLRDEHDGAFTTLVGDVGALRGTRYVITIDTDTSLPLGVARRLVAAMPHPLNVPRYDASRKRVVDGYGILQPRVSPGRCFD